MAAFDELPDLGTRYAATCSLGKGHFGSVYLATDRSSNREVAVKLIERGEPVARCADGKDSGLGPDARPSMVDRELINHRRLSGHPNIVQLYEVFLTPTHLAIVMEYAVGGELFSTVSFYGKLREHEARHLFKELIRGVDWCHHNHVCHRDLKLENSLLASDLTLKICDFGYSKSGEFDSQPKSAVGTPAYVAPEVLDAVAARQEYSGELADVWSCGVMLYTMLVGAYPFHDPRDPANHKLAVENIRAAAFTFPEQPVLSEGAKDLIGRIFVLDPQQRINLADIQQHPWFRQGLEPNLTGGGQLTTRNVPQPAQSEADMRAIVQAAKELPPNSQPKTFNAWEFMSSSSFSIPSEI